MQGKATCDERDGSLGTARASVLCRVSNASRRGACAGSIWLSRLPHRDLPSSEPSEGPRRVDDAWAGGCGGCLSSFQSGQVEGRAESAMMLAAVSQEEALDEKWHGEATRRDRQGE